MASGTLYGPAAGSGGHWRAYAKWSDSQTETTFTCNWTTGMQSLAYGIRVNYVYADVYLNGSGRTVDNQTFSSGTGATVMKDMVSHSVTIKKTKSTQRVSAYCTVTNHSGYLNGSSSINSPWTIPALKSYSVSYNANGGSGAPSAQTKWYGETLTLSSVKPTRTGYTFAGWNTNSSGTGTNYSAGGSYTGNAAVTLYAKWTAITYTVSYNANGGTGAPGNQTKTYGQTLTLSTTVPTRTNYNFKGWATSASATTPNYQPGGSYTANAAVTLYAVWEIAYIAPRIMNVTADRCTSDGTLSEEGTYALVKCDWATDKGMNDCHIVCNGQNYGVSGVTIGATSGVFNQVVGNGTLSTENSYIIQLVVGDTMGSSTYTITLAPLAYIIDFSPQGGVSIGEPAEDSKRFDVHIPTYNKSTVTTNGLATFTGGSVHTGSTYINNRRGLYFKDVNGEDAVYVQTAGGAGQLGIHAKQVVFFDGADGNSNPGNYTDASTGGGTLLGVSHIYMRQNAAIMGRLTSGSWSSMLRLNTANQVELNWTSGGLKGRVMKQIWSGSAGTNATINIPEMPYYNLFLAKAANEDKLMVGVRGDASFSIAFGVSWASKSFVYTMGFELDINNANSTSGTLITQPWYQRTDGTAIAWAYAGNLTKIYGLL